VYPKILTLAVASSLFVFSGLQAQTIPDAGSLLRDQQQKPQEPNKLQPPEIKEIQPSPVACGVTVNVKGFTFTGYEKLVAENELKALVASSEGKTLTFEELDALTVKITSYLRERGWIMAQAYLPKQDVTSGIIQIVISQGKSDGRITFKFDNATRISEKRLRAMSASAVHLDEAINMKKLERTVLLMNDLSGVTCRASFAPGAAMGTSRLSLDINEGPALSGTVWGDNHGNTYTGSWRHNASFSFNDPFGWGDQLSFLWTIADGLNQGRIGYTFPIATSGLKGNLAFTSLNYELGKDLLALDYKGRSKSIDAGISYPLLRSRAANVTTGISYGYKALLDTKSSIEIRDRELNSATFSVDANRFDKLFGGGYTSGSFGVTTGKFNEYIADVSRTGTEGGYTRFNLGISRLQRIVERVNVNFSLSGQKSVCNLDSSEKFSLGGPNGIRAYPMGEGAGDEGYIISNELHYDLPVPPTWGNYQIAGFYDAGHITLNRKRYTNDVSTATNLNDYWLQGIGIGVNCAVGGRFNLRSSWAHVIGDNPGRSVSGNDSDGRNDKSRFWIQAILYF
jgi:hemolysin activation/secretion protein